jgi:DNA transformation protein and related proteins
MDEEAVVELFEQFGPVHCKRMFGGLGIYAGELMFGLVADGEIFLKIDADSQPRFADAGSSPFSYTRRDGRSAMMSYWRLPSEALDDPERAAEWAKLGLEAARRSAVAKPAKRAGKGR